MVLPLIYMVSCTSEQAEEEVDCSVSPLVLSVASSSEAACNQATGSFALSVSGGQSPYSFNLNNEINTTGSYSSLDAGSYEVTVTDAAGCSENITVSIDNTNGVNLQNLVITDAGCGATNGSIEVSASGGTEPYSYTINGGTSQQEPTFSNLSPGSYEIEVTDASGCSSTQSGTVLTGVSFSASVEPIINQYCIKCHSEFGTFGTIQAKSSNIQSRTSSGDMPRDATLTQEQKDLIACWVEDGALNN